MGGECRQMAGCGRGNLNMTPAQFAVFMNEHAASVLRATIQSQNLPPAPGDQNSMIFHKLVLTKITSHPN